MILILGANDLCDISLTPLDVANKLYELAMYLTSFVKIKVVVCQLLQREHMLNFLQHWPYPIELLNDRIQEANGELMRLCLNSRVKFWKIRGVSRPIPELFSDGVHMSDFGNERISKSLRSLIVHYLKVI